jgi:hypothetical protein
MKLTAKQKEFIDGLLTEEITEDNLPEIHETIYEKCLDDVIINFDDVSDDDFEDADEIYSNLVWDYLESKI